MKTSLLTELRKHAAYSAALRASSITKSAGFLGATLKGVWHVAKPVVATVARHPMKATTLAGGMIDAGARASQAQQAFKPEIQRLQLGINEEGLPSRG